MKANVVEIGPRDGFQNVKEFIPTQEKLQIIDGLVEAGFKKIQITSFVSPKAIPQMRDAAELSEVVLSLSLIHISFSPHFSNASRMEPTCFSCFGSTTARTVGAALRYSSSSLALDPSCLLYTSWEPHGSWWPLTRKRAGCPAAPGIFCGYLGIAWQITAREEYIWHVIWQ